MRGDVKLGPKVLIFIGVSLVVILGISFALMLKQREREALERTSLLMEHVGRAVATSMQRAMRDGDMESIQELVVEVGADRDSILRDPNRDAEVVVCLAARIVELCVIHPGRSVVDEDVGGPGVVVEIRADDGRSPDDAH